MIIKTNRCFISTLQQTDVGKASRLFTDESVRRYLGGTIDERTAIEKLNSWINNNNGIYLTVSLLENGDFVGIISVTDHHDSEHKELSYQFLPEFWGRGLAFESISKTFDFLKTNTDLTTLIAETQSKNQASCKLLEKLGFSLADNVMRFGEDQYIYKKVL
ncbi:MAG: GNAT family N-acetyltransferase [Ruminococcaceae bacterium]|nr:GNAT family N-acetyltransferase [Oscillospiraceae bacterium]